MFGDLLPDVVEVCSLLGVISVFLVVAIAVLAVVVLVAVQVEVGAIVAYPRG